jgi:hypothetical protein
MIYYNYDYIFEQNQNLIEKSDSEIERLIKGEIIQTQYSWLQIGKRMK